MRPRLVLACLVLTLPACDCGGSKTHAGGGVLGVEEEKLEFGAVCPKPDAEGVMTLTATRSVHVSNIGNALLYLNKFEIDDQVQFAFDGKLIPESLEPGEGFEVPITFTASASGAVEATLTVEGDDSEVPPMKVSLLGSGLPGPAHPVVTLSCPNGKWSNDSCAGANPSLFFPDALVKGTGTHTLLIGNGGCPPLEVKNLRIANDDPTVGTFSLSEDQSALNVLGGATAPVVLKFNPLVRDAPVSGTLTFETNDPAAKTFSLSLQGIGVQPALSLEPLFCDFAPLAAPCDGKFTLSNTSSQPLDLGTIALEKSESIFQIAQAPPSGTRLQPGDKATVQVTYVAAAPTTRDALVVNWSGGKSTASLSGGSPPVLGVTPNPLLDFGDRKTSGQDYYLPVELTNLPTWNAQVALSLTAVEVDARFPSNSSAFSLAADPTDSVACPAPPAPGTTLAAGASTKACVKFAAPASGGSFVANLLVRTNDPLFPEPDGYLLSLAASTNCNRAPVAEVFACVGSNCPKTPSIEVHLTEGTVRLSGETSYDLIADATGACAARSSKAIAAYDWLLVRQPATSTAALSTVTAASTELVVDREGLFVVQLIVTDETSLPSVPVTFNVTAVP
ncbi:MAG: choice-of-anchor D domain-containing protein [Myxococcales bacterium]